MPINPNIAMSFRPAVELQQTDPLRDYATLAQIQQSQIQNQLARQQLEQEQGVTNYLRSGADLSTPEGLAGLRPFGKVGLAYQKLISEEDTNRLRRQELEGKLRDQRMTALGTGLTSVMNDPSDANLTAAFDRLDATGVDTKPFRQQLLPMDLASRQTAIKSYVTSNPEGRQALAFVQPKPEKVDLHGKVVVLDMNPNSPTYQQQVQEFGKTMSPSDLTADARARERLRFDQQKFEWEKANPGYEIKDTESGFVAVNKRNPTDVRPITMGAGGEPVMSNKGLTEAQAKATGFATRAKEADKILVGTAAAPWQVASKQGLEGVYGIGGLLGAAANVALPEAAQQVDQAQRNFVNAVLRQESGAAISASEFENARKQYFPQPGDSEKVIAQKAKNRSTAIQSLEVVAGPGMRKAEKTKGAAGANAGVDLSNPLLK